MEKTIDGYLTVLKSDDYTVEVYNSGNPAPVGELNTLLRSLKHTAIDTETVYDGNDMMTHRGADGTEITYKRRLDVDGPGSLRVITIAGIKSDGELYSCLIDCRDLDIPALAGIFAGVKSYAWNAGFDRPVLARDGISNIEFYDLMLADPTLRTGTTGGDLGKYPSLGEASKRWLGITMTGKSDTRLSYDETSDLSAEQIRYAAYDALITTVIGFVLMDKLVKANLMNSWLRNNAAQPFIGEMTRTGLPFDTVGYTQAVIDPARAERRIALETIALLTSGAKTLEFVGTVALNAGIGTGDTVQERGKSVLAESGTFYALLGELTEVRTAAEQTIAELAGGSVLQEDLFSATPGPVTLCPFSLEDEADIRKWLSKQSPIFAATVNATTLNPEVSAEQAETAAREDRAQLDAWSAGKKRLTAAHPMDSVILERMETSTCTDVTDDLRQLAKTLRDYREATRFLTDYGTQTAPVQLKPDWKVNASAAAKVVFNTYRPDAVKAFTKRMGNGPRLFQASDTLNADALTLLDDELADAILTYRHNETLVNGWGEKFLTHVHPVDGRVHSAYMQAITGTHRLNSRSPNAQNFSPLLKPFMGPADAGRVFICADLSQAELRFLADISGDKNMLDAFASGDDLHERTAGLMFSMNMKTLKTLDQSTATLMWDGPRANIVDNTTCDAITVEVLLGHLTGARLDELSAQNANVADLAADGAQFYKACRQKAKGVSFGYAYGIGAEKLALGLTVGGTPTTKEEAVALIDRFKAAYPHAEAWMQHRVGYINDLASAVHNGHDPIDWAGSWKLHWGTKQVNAARKKLGFDATATDISMWMASDDELRRRIGTRRGVTPEDVSDTDLGKARQGHVDTVTWVTSYDVSSVLRPNGNVWQFESRTAGNTARYFPVLTSDWEWGMVTTIVKTRDPRIRDLLDEWITTRNDSEKTIVADKRAAGQKAEAKTAITLYSTRGRRQPLRGKELEKQFDGTVGMERRTDLVTFIIASAPGYAETLYRTGMADRIRAMVNRYRNHPIQAGVSDAMLETMGRLHRDMSGQFPTARPVQSVHDSIVIECDRTDALGILSLTKKHMQDCLTQFVPTVVAKADADIQLSLDDKSIVELDDFVGDVA